MRLPELPGHVYKDLLGEDPFGWSFVTKFEDTERRVVKVLKSQAVSKSLIDPYLSRLSDQANPIEGAAPVHAYVLGEGEASPAYSMPFYGWKSKEKKRWQLTSLKRLMHLLPREQNEEIIRKLAVGVSQVHDAGLFHGGLKLGDVFLSSDSEGNQEVRIGGFGQIFMGGLQYLEAGELLFYVSPEQLETGDFSNDMGKRWDVYSFGVVAFQLLTGHLPRLDHIRQQCLEKPGVLEHTPAISYGSLTSASEQFLRAVEAQKPVEWPDASSDAKEEAIRDVIERCLEFDHRDRPASMKAVSEALEEALNDGPALAEQTEAVGAEEAVQASVAQEQQSPAAKVAQTAKAAIGYADEVKRVKEPIEKSEQKDTPTTRPRPNVTATVKSASSAEEEGLVAEKTSPKKEPTEALETVAAAPQPPDPEALESSVAKESSSLGRELDEELNDLSALPQGGRKSAKGKVVRYFEDRPELKWKIAAIAAAVGLLVSLGFGGYKSLELRNNKKSASFVMAELKKDLQKKADDWKEKHKNEADKNRQFEEKLSEGELSRSRFMGEVKLARQVVRQTQENGDHFFRMVLENRDTDVPGFRESRASSLADAQKHYERLIKVYGDAPEFYVSTANALFYLGRIYCEMGQFDQGLRAFEDAERRYMALLEDAGKPEVEFIRNLAIANQEIGSLAYHTGDYPTARHYLSASSRWWREVREADDAESVDAGNSIHENSLTIAESEFALSRLDTAYDMAQSVGGQLLKLQETDPDNDRIAGSLGRAFALAGRIFESRGDGDKAKAAYEQASNHFAKAVKANAAVDAYQLGLGNSLARVGLLEGDMKKLEASVDVLAGVIASNPFKPEFQRTLADVYGVMARNQRDGGHPNNAIRFEKEAIGILQPIIQANPDKVAADVLYSYSQRLAHLAELLGDSGDFDDSREPLQEAIAVLERISRGDSALAEYNRALARARGLAGFAWMKTGDQSKAKQHLELAMAEWESYIASHPDDSDAAQAVRWTSDQLRNLR